MWHFIDNDRSLAADRFSPNSSFNSKNKDAMIETCLRCLNKRLLDTEVTSKRLNNLAKEEREALLSVKGNPSIIIKGNEKDPLSLPGTERII